MPEVQIRSAIASDLPLLLALDHSCQSESVWQMDLVRAEGQAGAVFREIRLPHPVLVRYPRSPAGLSEAWGKRSGVLVAEIDGQAAGYTRIQDTLLPGTAWITDLVVGARHRRQGVAMALVLAALAWGREHKSRRAQLEMTSKNLPAIRLAQKLGFEFCGYNDRYYETQDIALFFTRSIG